MNVNNIPIYKDGKVISYFSGDDSTLSQSAQRLGGTVDAAPLSGTNNPSPVIPTITSPSPAPVVPTIATSELPSATTSDNPLLKFKDAIAKIDEMARQNRNAFVPSLEGAVPSGTMNASSFGDIVKLLNSGGSNYASETAKNAIDTQTKSGAALHYVTNDAGDVTALDPATGATVWTKKGVGNKQGGSTDTKAESNDIASAVVDFQNQMTTKGWAGANPQAYQYYRGELSRLYGANAALKLDKAMFDAGISVDTSNT